MKNTCYSALIIAAIFLSSCVKDAVEKPDFDVKINKTTFIAGDTAKFAFSGKPNNLVFYSGTSGNDYYTRNTFTATGGVPSVIFTTALTAAAGSSTASNLKVLISNNFNGKYNQSDILAANWTDLTSQVTIPAANQTFNLSAYLSDGKPLYVAFKFETIDVTKIQRQVTISNFRFQTVYPTQTYTNASNVYNAGFAPFDFGGSVGAWIIPVTSVTNNTFSHPLVAAMSPKDDDWAISTAFYANAVLPGTGTPLKSISSNALTNYQYVFTTPGTYKMVFVASNNNAIDYKEVLKEFTVIVN